MVVCPAFINPLNLECLLVNTFAETGDIFIGLAFLALATLASFFRMGPSTFFLLTGLFMMFIASTIQVSTYMMLFLVIGGVFVVTSLKKAWQF